MAQDDDKKKEQGAVMKAQYTAMERLKLLQGAIGIYFFFITYGRMQEKIFKYKTASGGTFKSVWFLQACDALANVLVGGIGRLFQGTQPGLPQEFLACAGVGQVVSKYCLSASLAAGLSFPVATLAKSAKLVPVMIGSLLIGGATFSTRQISQALAIVGGTGIVTLSEGGGKNKKSSMLGLSLIALALGCDGLVGGIQRRMKAKCKAEKKKELPFDMMFWTNFWMFLAALVFAGAKSEIREGLKFCRANPAIQKQILQFSVCGALGQACIFYMIANFNSVVATSITTTRKLASVIVSLVESGKSLPPTGWAGFGLASAGIIGEVL